MTTVADILSFLESIAPPSLKADWDNVGLLCGQSNKEVHTILVALDPFESVCREAAQLGADLIVTHHPLIFQPLHAITDSTYLGRDILFLISHDIAAVNAHTNLDCAPGGVNDTLAAILGLKDIQVIAPNSTDAQDTPMGLLRKGTVQTQPLKDFLLHIKEVLGCEGLRYVDGGKPVHRVAVGGGACASGLLDVMDAGCDTFVTADVKYNQFWDAKNMGLNLIDAGHFQTENPICNVLVNKLQAAFPECNVLLSKSHRDCMRFF